MTLSWTMTGLKRMDTQLCLLARILLISTTKASHSQTQGTFAATKNQLRQLIKQNQLGQIKFDGFIAREERSHDDLLPREDSVEPLAERSLELIAAGKDANAKLFTEPTYLNSIVNYSSPWMIRYADSVWAGAGSDCVSGLGPAPDYRESQTTSRESFVMSALDEIWLPQNAIQSFDILHCDAAGGFPNHAAAAFGRGRFFVSTYINPKFMTDADWQIYAGLLKWARRNEEVLQNTVVLTSRVELGEPYAYAHWSRTRGILAVRNPSNESREFTLDLAKAGAPKGLSDAVCYTVSLSKRSCGRLRWRVNDCSDPCPLGTGVPGNCARLEVREPVAIGARWYRDADGDIKISSEGSRTIHLLLPGGGEQVVDSSPLELQNPHGEVRSLTIDPLPESDWFLQCDKPLATASFELDCEISIPDGAAKGNALLLLEFPGKQHLATNCCCQVNGRAAVLRESSSAAHIGGFGGGPESAWKRLEPYASHWTWYICKLVSGRAEVKFSGTFPYERCKIGLWVWVDWELTEQAVPVSIQCPEPTMPQYQDHLRRQGICVLSPRTLRESAPADGRSSRVYRWEGDTVGTEENEGRELQGNKGDNLAERVGLDASRGEFPRKYGKFTTRDLSTQICASVDFPSRYGKSDPSDLTLVS
jgi:hypothetical protein